MRPPSAWLVLLAWFAGFSPVIAQDPESPVPYSAAEISFFLPKSWQASSRGDSASPGVIFAAEGSPKGRLTITRLPSDLPARSPLDSKMDPLTAPELVDTRITLEEIGLKPVAGAVSSTSDQGVMVESISFRCKPNAGSEVVILTTTWHVPGKPVRARLQYSTAYPEKQGGVLNGIRTSLRFRNSRSSGFGNFQMAAQPVPANWAKLTRVSATAAASAGKTAAADAGVPLPASLAVMPSTDTPAAAGDVARIVQEYRGSLVFIEGGGGAGSGFVCQQEEGNFLLTNQHVLAGMAAPQFTRLDRSPLATGAGAAAIGHDLMRFATKGEVRPLPAMTNVESGAQIGDEIVVLGNMEGARVIQPLQGKLVGIGPDRVEVTAEFLPGNSGSPIVHVKTGKVLGIATYLMKSRHAELTDSGEARVRRFGYRLDSVKQWQNLNWQLFQQEKGTMDRVESTTRDLVQLLRDMQGSSGPNAAAYNNQAVARAVRELEGMLSRKGLSAPDRSRAFFNFIAAIRAATQTDITQARQVLRYDFFTRALSEEAKMREEMYKIFDRVMKTR